MAIKGFVLLLACIGLIQAARLSNYLNKAKLDDQEATEKKVTAGKNEYQKPNVEETISSTVEVSPTTEESIISEEETEEEEEEVTEKPQTEEKEKPKTEDKEKTETKNKKKPATKEKEKTVTEATEKPETEEEENPATVEEENSESEEDANTETEEKKPADKDKKKPSKEKPETEEGESNDETTTEKPFIGKKCSFKKADVEKTYGQWCDAFGKKDYAALLQMYSKDGYVRVLSDTYHLHNVAELQKLLEALKVLETSFKISKCEDFLTGHTSFGCDPKTKTAQMKGVMKTVHFDPPITGSFNEILIEEDGKLKIHSQDLNIAD